MATRKKKKTSKEAEEFMERIRNAGSKEQSFEIVLEALGNWNVSPDDHKKIHRVYINKWFGLHLAIKSLNRARARVERYLNQQPTN